MTIHGHASAGILASISISLLFRAIISRYPHSGFRNPPLHGDFEAQRHWVEVTTHLPVGEWYENSTSNNLLYWGLDYPPMTAYHSMLIGRAAAVVDPKSFEFFGSRGSESQSTILTMRSAAILSDTVVLFPAAVIPLVLGWIRPTGRGVGAYLKTSLPLLLCPGLLLIDHGHFQFNGVSLGLAIAAAMLCVAWTRTRIEANTCKAIFMVLAGCCLFTVALCYKQMELYHAPAFFCFLLGAAAARTTPPEIAAAQPAKGAEQQESSQIARALISTCSDDQPGSLSCSSTWRRALASGAFWAWVLLFGGTVVAVLVVCFMPFCVWADRSVWEDGAIEATSGGGLDATRVTLDRSQWTSTCLGGVAQVLHRVFPFQRGLFEDKVANIWCALEPLLRLRTAVRLGQVSLKAIVSVATGLTLLLLVPVMAAGALLPIALRRSQEQARHSIDCTALHCMLLMMEVSAMAFFLGSFQVHEKSVLLALAPACCLAAGWGTQAGREPGWVHSWIVWIGTATMVPLLMRDGLGWPTLLLQVAWAYVYGSSWCTGWVRDIVGLQLSLGSVLKAAAACGSIVGTVALLTGIAVHVGFDPPASMPDLYVLGVAVAGCACLFSGYVASANELVGFLAGASDFSSSGIGKFKSE